jgi:alanine-glyoxylate transaminase/serine-glyoxylate transaminase/serine-pyruvate transaminase
MPGGHSADALRALILKRFDMSLGNGLGRLADKVFRIGHLGDFNDLAIMAVLSGVEMGLDAFSVPHRPGGVQAAMVGLAMAPERVTAAKQSKLSPARVLST